MIRRAIGRSDEVRKLLLREPQLFADLLECLWHKILLVRMRAADAAEKVTAVQPELLNRHKQALLGLLADTEQIELTV
jgi:hypothetical protein